MGYHHEKGHAGSGLLRTNLENVEKHLSRATSFQGYQFGDLSALDAKKGQHSTYAILGDLKVSKGTSDGDVASGCSE